MRVLITGTTSGIGKALANFYLRQGNEVIAVNRRESETTRNGQLVHVLDIADSKKVKDLLQLLSDSNTLPDIFVLNAGINLPDNSDHFDFSTYDNVMRTNLNGVLTFVSALQQRGIEKKTILALSSTSNIIPNPAHVGYYLSKLCLQKAFKIFSKRDPKNQYKTVILGPVHTNIMAGYPGPQGIQAKIFNLLAVSAETAAGSIASFISSPRKTFYYTKPACAFYWCVRLLLIAFPGLYGSPVSRPNPATVN